MVRCESVHASFFPSRFFVELLLECTIFSTKSFTPFMDFLKPLLAVFLYRLGRPAWLTCVKMVTSSVSTLWLSIVEVSMKPLRYSEASCLPSRKDNRLYHSVLRHHSIVMNWENIPLQPLTFGNGKPWWCNAVMDWQHIGFTPRSHWLHFAFQHRVQIFFICFVFIILVFLATLDGLQHCLDICLV